MTDVTQAPANDTPPPPPSTAPDVVHRHIPEPISTGRGDEENIRESVRVLNEKRERQWESGGDDPFAEQRAPVIERHYGRRDKSPKSLKQATADISNRHFEELPDVQQTSAWLGVDPAQLREFGKNPEFVAQQRPDWTPAEVSEYVRTGRMPPHKIGVVTERGGLRPPIRDDEPIFDVPKERLYKNATQATREVKNFRDVVAAEQQQLLAQLQDQEQAAQAEQPAQAKQEAAQPQFTPQPQPRPDPVAAQQRAFHQAAQTYAQLAQMTHEEHLAAAAAEQWRVWPYQKYPELRDAAALERTRQTNPARFAEIVQDVSRAKLQFDIQEAKWTKLGQARQAHEAAIVQQQQQQVQAATRAYIQQEDTKFHAHFEREFPQYASKAGRAEIRRGVQLALHKAGVSEEEVSQLWRSGALRAVQTQMILARAGAWELAQERAAIAREQLADKRAPIPPVQRPGVARPRGAGAEGDVRALSQQLENATGNAALRIATKLTQARRRAAGF